MRAWGTCFTRDANARDGWVAKSGRPEGSRRKRPRLDGLGPPRRLSEGHRELDSRFPHAQLGPLLAHIRPNIGMFMSNMPLRGPGDPRRPAKGVWSVIDLQKRGRQDKAALGVPS